MAHPSEAEAAQMAREDSGEAIELAHRRDRNFPVVTIADGGDRHAQATDFHRRWWRQGDEDWPEALRETYNEAFTEELMAARVAVVELHFDAARGSWSNIGVVDLEQWEPTFPFDPASSGWVKQDARSRVGWRRRSLLRKLFGGKNRSGQIAGLAALLAMVLVGTAAGHGGSEPAVKNPFWLGTYFAGLRVTNEDDYNGATVLYGDCELPEGEGGCSLPAQVQTTTACARNPIAIDRLPYRIFPLRGGGLAVAYEPTAVDVGTGNRTVTVYTNELELMSAALREVRRRSQPAPRPLPPPIYSRTVLRELKRVTAVAARGRGAEAIARATGLSPAEVRVRLRISDLLGPGALAGVPVPKISTAAVERLRQLAFQAHEVGFARTAREHGLSTTELRAKIRSVRGLVGYC